MAKLEGKIKWFNLTKGYGFITDADGKDVFVHASSIEDGRTYKGFDPGDVVEYELVDGKKGTEAANVSIVKSDEK